MVHSRDSMSMECRERECMWGRERGRGRESGMNVVDCVLTISLGYSLANAPSEWIVQYCSWQFVSSLGMGSLQRAYTSADCSLTAYLLRLLTLRVIKLD